MKLLDSSIEAALRKEIAGPIVREDLLQIHGEAVRRHRRGRRFRVAMVLLLLLGPAVMLFGPSMGAGTWAPLRWPFLGIILAWIIGVAIMLGLYMVMRPAYTGLLRSVARERGHEVCPGCGYWLENLNDEVTKCPECGAAREPMPTPKL